MNNKSPHDCFVQFFKNYRYDLFVLDFLKTDNIDEDKVFFLADNEKEVFKRAKLYGVSTQIYLKIKHFLNNQVHSHKKLNRYISKLGKKSRKNDRMKKFYGDKEKLAEHLFPVFSFDFQANSEKLKRNFNFIKELKGFSDDFALFKGIALAKKYHLSLLARHTGDVDIIVPQKVFKKFEKKLIEWNFYPVPRSKIKDKYGHVYQFVREDGLSCGLHLYISDRFFAEIKYEDLEFENISVELGGDKLEVRTFSPEFDLIQLSLHLFQHCFALRIFLDIFYVLRSSRIDYTKLFEISRRFKIEQIVLISLLSSSKIFCLDFQDRFFVKRIQNSFLYKYSDFLSSFVSQPFFFLVFRNFLFYSPYFDKIFSLFLASKFPVRKFLNLLPYFPSEFLRRLKGEYTLAV
jgi:hypothetical protein